MSDNAPDVKYVTITKPSQLKRAKPPHRVKVEMPEWETEGGADEVPIFWATQLRSLERSQFKASLEKYDEEHGFWYTSAENEQPHWLAFCLRDHQGHRIWEDLKEAREQLGEFPAEDIQKLMNACNEAQTRPRAEGNDPSGTTPNDKPSGTTPEEPASPIQTAS